MDTLFSSSFLLLLIYKLHTRVCNRDGMATHYKGEEVLVLAVYIIVLVDAMVLE